MKTGSSFFLKKYPFVDLFIQRGKQEQASRRLDLDTFITQARAAMDWEIRLSANEKKLLAALRVESEPDINRALKAMRSDLINFIIILIKQREFTCIAHLINLKPEIDLTPATIYFSFSKNKQNSAGDTMVHVAARLQCIPMLAAVLTHDPDLTIENTEKQTALKFSAGKIAKALVRLNHYKQKIAADNLSLPSLFGRTPSPESRH